MLALICSEAVSAEPAAIAKAKNEAAALEDRIDELNQQLEAAVEDYNYAKEKLGQTKAAIEDKRAKLKRAEADLEKLRARFTERMVQIYKQGDMSALDVLVGAVSFSDFINRLDMLERLSEQDSLMLTQVEDFRAKVAEREAELTVQLEEEKALAAQTETAKNKVQKTLAANEKALAGKEAQIAKLQREEAARQARLAAEAKARAEAAKKAAAKKAAEASAAKKAAAAIKPGSGGSTQVKVSVPSSASGNTAVSIGLQYIGCDYVWAGSSPSGFDCSGFVMYVYNKMGISLPHSSRMQYGCGVAVSRGDLRPGDLVFFYNPIHHVGIYIGDGKMVHAAGVGKGVRIDSVYRNSYTGACRIIL